MSNEKARAASNAKVEVQGGAYSTFSDTRSDEPIPNLFGPTPGLARLMGNENPFGPSPRALPIIADCVARSSYYADRPVFRLIAMIAERHDVAPSQVVLSSGSTEILCAVAHAWGSKAPVLCPDLFWDAPIQFAEQKGAECVGVPMKPDLSIDVEGMADRLGKGSFSLVHLVNPNNPTGLLVEHAKLKVLAEQAGKTRATLLVDEAYNELADSPEESSAVDLVREGADVIVTRTFSKIYGMAGLRVGYAISSEENIARIRGYLTSFGGNTAGLAGAIASYDDEDFLSFSRSATLEGRAKIMEAVKQCGLSALPSQTNFVFVKVPDADAVKEAMERRGILIRGAFGKWKKYSRVSIGSAEEVDRYVKALPEVIDELG